MWKRVRMPKSEAEHDNTKQLLPKKEDFKSSLTYLSILIVAEVERFRSTAGFIVSFANLSTA
jgi:hypothetical protein